MNRFRGLTRFAGSVPQPIAIYRAPIVGGGSMLPFELGVCSFELPELAEARTVEELRLGVQNMQARLIEIQEEAGVQPLGDEARAEWDAIDNPTDGRLRAFQLAQREAEARRARVAELAEQPAAREEHRSLVTGGTPVRSRIPEDLHDLTEYRKRTNGDPAAMTALMRDGAKKVADQISILVPGVDQAAAVKHMHKLIDQSKSDQDPGHYPESFIRRSSAAYESAWTKAITGRSDMLTPAERASIGTVGSGQATLGGYAVPVILDPAVIPTSDGATNPLPTISRVETITGPGNTWNGVTSSGIILSRGPAEKTAITENALTYGQPTVTVQPVKGEVKYSVESEEDQPRLLTELAIQIRDAQDAEEADSFVNGVGSTVYPAGIVQTLDASSLVGTGGNGFGLEDITRLITRLPDRWEPRARFLAHRAVYGEAEDLQAALGGTSVSDLAAGAQRSLKGYPRHNSSAMSSAYTTADEDILLFGDFSNFLIVRKVGLQVRDAGYVRDTNGALTGERALFIFYRNSSVILVDNAFRLLRLGVVQS